MGDSGGSGPAALDLVLQEVASRLAAYDGRLEPTLADETLWVAEPATGWPVMLGLAGDGRGNTKLFASARVDRALSRVVGSNLGRMLGMVQVLPVDDGSEVRRWSPYRIEDIERTPQEAIAWSVTTIEAMLEELRARGRAVVPPPLDPKRVYSFEPFPDDSPTPVATSVPPKLPATAPGAGAPVAPAPAGDAVALAALDALREQLAEREAELSTAQADLSAARSDIAEHQQLLDAALRERDAIAGQLREAKAASSAQHGASVDPVPKLVSAFGLLADVGTRASTCIEVLRRFLDIAPGDPRLREELGIYLLKDDQVPEALSILGELGAGGLTPRGASALVEASFRQRRLPDDLDVLGRVDWRMGNVSTFLRDLPTWAPREHLLEVAEVIRDGGAPPEFEALLGSIAKLLPAGDLRALFAIWLDLDLNAALDQVLGWLDDKRITLAQKWVREAIELALTSDERRVARTALDRLIADAAERRDGEGLLRLIGAARDLLKASDWRGWSVPWIREGVSIGGPEARMNQYAGLVLDVLHDTSSLREGDPEHELITVLEHRVSVDLARQLQAERDRLQPVDITVRDVTTVSEALKAARERYAGLVVLADAEQSGAKRGTKGVAKAREALFALGEVADRYAAGELDEGLDEALAGLPGYKPDVSDSAKQQYRSDYLRTLPGGQKIMLGPHVDIGGEEGRAYFAIDRERKRIVVGYLGHLRGKRDT